MSHEDAETLMDEFEKQDARKAKHSYITRMEHKLFRRDRARATK